MTAGPNPTEIPMVEAIRAVYYCYGLPLLLHWPEVSDILWVNGERSWWTPRWGTVNWARILWWN